MKPLQNRVSLVTGATRGIGRSVALDLARRYDFMLFVDECYSEIYFRDEAPLGGLEAAAPS